jgi:hypothetical protein
LFFGMLRIQQCWWCCTNHSLQHTENHSGSKIMTFIPLGANQPSNGWKISIWAIEFIQQHTIEIQRGLSWETYSLSIGAFIALQYDGKTRSDQMGVKNGPDLRPQTFPFPARFWPSNILQSGLFQNNNHFHREAAESLAEPKITSKTLWLIAGWFTYIRIFGVFRRRQFQVNKYINIYK